MKLHPKSHIAARKSNLHNDALHISVDLWGWIRPSEEGQEPGLLNFGKIDQNRFVIAAHSHPQDKIEVPTEEFSTLIWRVPIVDDWDELEDDVKNRVYASIVEQGKMFFTLRLDK